MCPVWLAEGFLVAQQFCFCMHRVCCVHSYGQELVLPKLLTITNALLLPYLLLYVFCKACCFHPYCLVQLHVFATETKSLAHNFSSLSSDVLKLGNSVLGEGQVDIEVQAK